MTPEEELKRLNKLIHQYETVYRTTSDADQRDRVENELKQLQSYRDKILAVNVIDGSLVEEIVERVDELAEFPILKRLVTDAASRPPERTAAAEGPGPAPSSAQREIEHLALYTDFFQREYLPFLTDKHLKLDFAFSMDRDSFYQKFHTLGRKLENFRQEYRRLSEGIISRDMEVEIRKRGFRLMRIITVEAAKLFREIRRFCRELVEDADEEGVRCLNGGAEIEFDSIEGSRILGGRTVRGALEEMETFAAEAIEWINVPDLESKENDCADRD
jgi:hypothetical protein